MIRIHDSKTEQLLHVSDHFGVWQKIGCHPDVLLLDYYDIGNLHMTVRDGCVEDVTKTVEDILDSGQADDLRRQLIGG